MEKKHLNYWITSHWPLQINDTSGKQEGIFASDASESVVRKMRVGDMVFIYESKNGRVLKSKKKDGTIENIPCHIGREGIVAVVEVECPYDSSNSVPSEYTDGTEILWKYYFQTKCLDSNGFVPRMIINKFLGYSENYNFRGFGDKHSGLKVISEDIATKLLKSFKSKTNNEI